MSRAHDRRCVFTGGSCTAVGILGTGPEKPVSFQLPAMASVQVRVAFLPNCKIRRKAAKPGPFDQTPQTLGDHLRRRRAELGLYQKEVALRLDVDEHTIINWEKDRTTPPVRLMPRIIDFLGYYPYRPPRKLGERLTAIRRNLGVSRARLAQMIGIDEGTVLRIERTNRLPIGPGREKVRVFFVTCSANVSKSTRL